MSSHNGDRGAHYVEGAICRFSLRAECTLLMGAQKLLHCIHRSSIETDIDIILIYQINSLPYSKGVCK